MSQVSGTPATAHGRSAWRVLRPVLVLGGFVAVWWALTTGVAHAEASPHGLGDTVRAAAKAQHSSPVRDVVRRVHHEARPTTTKVATHVRHQAAPVTNTVSSVVDATPVAPVKQEVTETIRSAVSDTVKKTRSLLAKTAADPGRRHRRTPRPRLSPRSANPQQGKGILPPSALPRRPPPPRSWTCSPRRSDSSQRPPPPSTSSGHRSRPSSPLDAPGGTPPVHDPCASPSGSSSTSFTPVGVTESSWLVMPSVLRDLPTWRLARLPGGPAYQPGSSPD